MIKPVSPIYINVKGQLLDLAVPQVMGILNVTPDSFYSGSRMQTEEDIAARARQIIDEGAAILWPILRVPIPNIFLPKRKCAGCAPDWRS